MTIEELNELRAVASDLGNDPAQTRALLVAIIDALIAMQPVVTP